MDKVVLVAGGTGGHVFVALAMAERLQRQGVSVSFITDARGWKWLSTWPSSFSVHILDLRGPSGSWIDKIIFAFSACVLMVRALFLLRRLRPTTVWGFGAYMTVPIMMAAWLLRLKTAVHQSDVVLGRANSFLARFVDIVGWGWIIPDNLSPWLKAKSILALTPLRLSFEHRAQTPLPESEKGLNLLILGGSQGSGKLDHTVPEALKLLPRDLQRKLHVLHQSSPAHVQDVVTRYKSFLGTAKVKSFIDKAADAIAHAHLVISRGGALTLTELAHIGRRAIVVPIEPSPRDHQRANAQQFVQEECGLYVPERDCTSPHLAHILTTQLAAIPYHLPSARFSPTVDWALARDTMDKSSL